MYPHYLGHPLNNSNNFLTNRVDPDQTNILFFPKTGESSPKKRKLKDGEAELVQQLPPVVIVFEDFESFVLRVVQDFVTIAR